MAVTRVPREPGRRRRPNAALPSQLRRAEQIWLSRQLHDDLGPLLCAAGLQLSLMRTDSTQTPSDCNAALDAVQSILDRTVEQVRLLSYSICPDSAARCGLRDMVRMMARAFRAEVPEFESAPVASGPQAVELAGQLLDCLLLLPPPNGHPETRVLLLADSVVLDIQGQLADLLRPIASNPLRFWRCSLRERPRLVRTTLTWTLGGPQD